MGICYCKGAEEIADERNTEINVSRRFGIEENKEGVVTNGVISFSLLFNRGSKAPHSCSRLKHTVKNIFMAQMVYASINITYITKKLD